MFKFIILGIFLISCSSRSEQLVKKEMETSYDCLSDSLYTKTLPPLLIEIANDTN